MYLHYRYLSPTSLLLLMTMALGLAACASSRPDLPPDLREEVPQGANRIVMIQEGVPPADVFVDVATLLERKDFVIAYSSDEELTGDETMVDLLEDGPLVLGTAPKQVAEDMALKIMVNASPAPAGGLFVASARYADTVTAPDDAWHDAEWTSGKAKEAFRRAFDILEDATYDATRFEVGVMVQDEASPVSQKM